MADFSMRKKSQSFAYQKKAKKCIPGMTQLLSKRPDQFSYGVWPGYYSKAEGVQIWDLDGNRYIDMSISGIGANVLGYADPDVDSAVRNAIAHGTSCTLNCPEEVELAELMCDLHSWADMARFARTGGEAMAIAVRIARAATGKDTVAFCGYHGWHDWYLAANLGTENALGEHLLPGLNPSGVPRGLAGTALPFRYNHLEDLEVIVDEHAETIGAIIMEPIRSEHPIPGFIEGVRALADRINAVLIFDEISAGFRLSAGGAHLVIHSVTPDVAVFSKALGNGYPVASIIGRDAVMEAAQQTFISSTYWTERIGPVAALATIHKFRKHNVAKHLVHVGELIQEGWREASGETGLDIAIGGIPPLSHFVFQGNKALTLKAYFVQLMLERGFLASNLFYAMYAHSHEHVDQYLNAVRESFTEISHALASNDIEKKLEGDPASAGFKRLT